MNTATPIRNLNDWRGNATLYRLSPPYEGERYVVVSAIDLASRFHDEIGTPRPMQIETYIFAADANGKVENYGELGGSMKGTLDHAEALRGAGYEVKA